MRLFSCLVAFVFVAAVISSSSQAFAHHTKMSKSAASKLDAYEQVGQPVRCLPGSYKKVYPLDNHHIMFFLRGGRIFVGETQPDVKCRGMVNGRFLRFARQNRDEICRGDAIVTTTNGDFDHICYFLWFRELKVKKRY